MSNPSTSPSTQDPTTIRIRTQAGGILTHEVVANWLDPNNISDPLADTRLVDVYIEQVCHSVNHNRGLLKHAGHQQQQQQRSRGMHAILSQPASFYATLERPGGETTGTAILDAAGISPDEFRQLEYFFLPIGPEAQHGRGGLVVVSPVDHTVELVADSRWRSERAVSLVFHVVIRFLIHELGDLVGFKPWRFLWGHMPLEASGADGAAYTCLYVKALALDRPLKPDIDVGQGLDASRERSLRRLIVKDLEVAEWTDILFPRGEEDPVQRHYWLGSAAEPQNRLFWNSDPQAKDAAVDLRSLRSRTGKFDRFNVFALSIWCKGQPSIVDEEMRIIPRMRDHEQWALLSRQEFVTRVEEREVDILNGLFP